MGTTNETSTETTATTAGASSSRANGTGNGPSSPSDTPSSATAPGPPAERAAPTRRDSLEVAIPEDAPPSYDAAVANGDLRVAAGPARMDFSGPPPMPDRMTRPVQYTPTGGAVVPGVGVGYGQRFPSPAGPPPRPGWQSYPGQMSRPPPPPQHPNGAHYQYPSPTGPPRPPPLQTGSPVEDRTPTEMPVPGRPLLRGGQLLVYPKGHYCSKCGNTGYKYADPSNPCTSDWRKYGKAFNSALAHSYSIAPRPGANSSTTEATNFQRPLPVRHSAGPHSPAPGQYTSPQQYSPSPQQYNRPNIQYAQYGAPAPQNALYVQPGDPRIGGRLCQRCGGSGTEMSFNFFIFDERQCPQCRGLGRVF